MALKRVGELEIEEDMRFHERSWLMQRIGWIVIALLILAALAGVFGTGWLSKATASVAGGSLQVEYERFARYIAPTHLRIEFTPASGQRQVRLGVGAAFLETMQIERITPEPDSVEARGDQLVYLFSVSDAGQPGSVTFHLKAQRIGRASARIALLDGPSVTFEQFVYP